jgi:hypothetical protein
LDLWHLRKTKWGQAPVARACNPGYSGGKSGGFWFKASSRQIVQETLSQKNPSQKAGGVAKGVGPEFKPEYHQKKERQNSSSSKSTCLASVNPSSNPSAAKKGKTK